MALGAYSAVDHCGDNARGAPKGRADGDASACANSRRPVGTVTSYAALMMGLSTMGMASKTASTIRGRKWPTTCPVKEVKPSRMKGCVVQLADHSL